MDEQWLFGALIVIVLIAVFIVWGRRDSPEIFEASEINSDLEHWKEPGFVSTFSAAASGTAPGQWSPWLFGSVNSQVLFVKGYGRTNEEIAGGPMKPILAALEEVAPINGLRVVLIEADGRYIHVASTLEANSMHVLLPLNKLKSEGPEIMFSKENTRKLTPGVLSIVDPALAYVINNKAEDGKRMAIAVISIPRPESVALPATEPKPPRPALGKFLERFGKK